MTKSKGLRGVETRDMRDGCLFRGLGDKLNTSRSGQWLCGRLLFTLVLLDHELFTTIELTTKNTLVNKTL